MHEASLKACGGTSGCRERRLVECALDAAQNTFSHGQGGLFDVAASYAFHIAQAQTLFDGNKRTAISTAMVFLAGNGFAKVPTPQFLGELYDATIAIADRRSDKPGLAAVMRQFFTAA